MIWQIYLYGLPLAFAAAFQLVPFFRGELVACADACGRLADEHQRDAFEAPAGEQAGHVELTMASRDNRYLLLGLAELVGAPALSPVGMVMRVAVAVAWPLLFLSVPLGLLAWGVARATGAVRRAWPRPRR